MISKRSSRKLVSRAGIDAIGEYFRIDRCHRNGPRQECAAPVTECPVNRWPVAPRQKPPWQEPPWPQTRLETLGEHASQCELLENLIRGCNQQLQKIILHYQSRASWQRPCPRDFARLRFQRPPKRRFFQPPFLYRH